MIYSELEYCSLKGSQSADKFYGLQSLLEKEYAGQPETVDSLTCWYVDIEVVGMFWV